MGIYAGMKLKGIVKEEFRNDFKDIALYGEWSKSKDKKFKEFGNK